MLLLLEISINSVSLGILKNYLITLCSWSWFIALASFRDSVVGPIYGWLGQNKLCDSQVGNFHQRFVNLHTMVPLAAVSDGFCFGDAYCHSINSWLETFLLSFLRRLCSFFWSFNHCEATVLSVVIIWVSLFCFLNLLSIYTIFVWLFEALFNPKEFLVHLSISVRYFTYQMCK